MIGLTTAVGCGAKSNLASKHKKMLIESYFRFQFGDEAKGWRARLIEITFPFIIGIIQPAADDSIATLCLATDYEIEIV
jgi:hypothetical protein